MNFKLFQLNVGITKVTIWDPHKFWSPSQFYLLTRDCLSLNCMLRFQEDSYNYTWGITPKKRNFESKQLLYMGSITFSWRSNHQFVRMQKEAIRTMLIFYVAIWTVQPRCCILNALQIIFFQELWNAFLKAFIDFVSTLLFGSMIFWQNWAKMRCEPNFKLRRMWRGMEWKQVNCEVCDRMETRRDWITQVVVMPIVGKGMSGGGVNRRRPIKPEIIRGRGWEKNWIAKM